MLQAIADTCGRVLGKALVQRAPAGLKGAGRAIWEFRARGVGGHVGLELCGKAVSDR